MYNNMDEFHKKNIMLSERIQIQKCHLYEILEKAKLGKQIIGCLGLGVGTKNHL